MERLRTQLASDLHDEVSGLLAGISMQSELLRSKVDEDPVLDEKLQHIRQASQRAMSKISDVIWSIDARRDNIGQLISRMEEHADEVLLPLDVQYKIKLKGLEREKPIPANVRQDVYFIYKEAINNAAKHARATFVNITLEQTQQYFTLTIQDNGVGNAALATPEGVRGQGLSNMQMRAQRLNATLDMHNGDGFTMQMRMRAFV
jgi:signal transduction histidine kinase